MRLRFIEPGKPVQNAFVESFNGRFRDPKQKRTLRVQRLASTSLQAEERWGFVGSKREQLWQAEVIDPATRLVVAFATGVRNERLIGSSESVLQVLQEAVSRLSHPQGIVLFTDGEPSYKQQEDRTRTASSDWSFGSAPCSATPIGLPGKDHGAGSPTYATVKTGQGRLRWARRACFRFGSAGVRHR